MAPSLSTPFAAGIERRGPASRANADSALEPAYAPVLFVRCGLPLKRLRREETIWRRSHGPLRLEIQVESGCEIPYGQDRALLVLLATMAWRQRNRRLELGSAYEILQHLGQSATGADYQRLGERFSRLLNCRIRTWSVAKDSSIMSDRHFQIHEVAELWCKRKNSGCDVPRFRNSILLSEEFCAEIRRSPVQIPMPLVRSLLNAPGALDLSLLIAWRSHLVRPGRFVRVAISGRGGLEDQLSVKPYLQDRDFRRQVRTWLRHIKESWPECPAVLTQNAQDLLVCHGPLVVTPWEQDSKAPTAG